MNNSTDKRELKLIFLVIKNYKRGSKFINCAVYNLNFRKHMIDKLLCVHNYPVIMNLDLYYELAIFGVNFTKTLANCKFF